MPQKSLFTHGVVPAMLRSNADASRLGIRATRTLQEEAGANCEGLRRMANLLMA